MEYKLLCKYCGQEFRTKNKHRIFCSQSCSTKYNNKVRNYDYLRGNNNPAKRNEVRAKISDKLKNRENYWGYKVSKSLKASVKAKEARERAILAAQKSNIGKPTWNKGKKYSCKNRKGKCVGENNPSKRIEVREKISKKLKELYKSGNATCGFKSEWAKENIRKVLRRYPKISKAEYVIERYLIDKHINYIAQFSYKFGIADFYLPDYNTIIECYGKYWHNLPNYVERDKIKNKYLRERYKLIILWSEDILLEDKDNNLETYLKKKGISFYN